MKHCCEAPLPILWTYLPIIHAAFPWFRVIRIKDGVVNGLAHCCFLGILIIIEEWDSSRSLYAFRVLGLPYPCILFIICELRRSLFSLRVMRILWLGSMCTRRILFAMLLFFLKRSTILTFIYCTTIIVLVCSEFHYIWINLLIFYD